MNKQDLIKETQSKYEAWGFYAKQYNSLSEEERNEPSIGGRTRGQYLKDNYNMAKAQWENLTKQIATMQ